MGPLSTASIAEHTELGMSFLKLTEAFLPFRPSIFVGGALVESPLLLSTEVVRMQFVELDGHHSCFIYRCVSGCPLKRVIIGFPSSALFVDVLSAKVGRHRGLFAFRLALAVLAPLASRS